MVWRPRRTQRESSPPLLWTIRNCIIYCLVLVHFPCPEPRPRVFTSSLWLLAYASEVVNPRARIPALERGRMQQRVVRRKPSRSRRSDMRASICRRRRMGHASTHAPSTAPHPSSNGVPPGGLSYHCGLLVLLMRLRRGWRCFSHRRHTIWRAGLAAPLPHTLSRVVFVPAWVLAMALALALARTLAGHRCLVLPFVFFPRSLPTPRPASASVPCPLLPKRPIFASTMPRPPFLSNPPKRPSQPRHRRPMKNKGRRPVGHWVAAAHLEANTPRAVEPASVIRPRRSGVPPSPGCWTLVRRRASQLEPRREIEEEAPRRRLVARRRRRPRHQPTPSDPS